MTMDGIENRVTSIASPRSLESREFVDAGLQVFGFEDGGGAGAVGADEGCSAREFGILDVGIWEFAFAGVPPFDSFVAGGRAQGGLEQGLRGWIVFLADDSKVQRDAIEFCVG